LYELLAEVKFISAIWEADEFEAKAYWTQVEANSGLAMVEAYLPVLDAPDEYGEYDVWRIAQLLLATGHPVEALSLQEYLVEHYRQVGDDGHLQASLGAQAAILHVRGDLDRAMALLKEDERICRELGTPEGLARSLASQALLLAHNMGRPVEALPLADEAEQLVTEHGLHALAEQQGSSAVAAGYPSEKVHRPLSLGLCRA